MNTRSILLTSLVACTSAPGPLHSQHLPRPFVAVSQLTDAGPNGVASLQADEGPGPAIGGGVLGAFLGFWIGGWTTTAVADCTVEWCEVELFVTGAAIGEVLGMAAGTHLANGRRGNFVLDLFAAGGVGAMGIAAMGQEGTGVIPPSLASFGLIFAAQLAGTVIVERVLTH